MECYLTVTCANFPFLGVNNKEKPNTEKGKLFRDWGVKSFLSFITYWEKISISTVLITNSFPKIDKDLKTGF